MKRPDEIDDAFSSGYIHAGIGIERDRIIFSESQDTTVEKIKTSTSDVAPPIHHSLDIGKKYANYKERETKESSSTSELETPLCKIEKNDSQKKSLYDKSDAEFGYGNNDRYGAIGDASKKYR